MNATHSKPKVKAPTVKIPEATARVAVVILMGSIQQNSRRRRDPYWRESLKEEISALRSLRAVLYPQIYPNGRDKYARETRINKAA